MDGSNNLRPRSPSGVFRAVPFLAAFSVPCEDQINFALPSDKLCSPQAIYELLTYKPLALFTYLSQVSHGTHRQVSAFSPLLVPRPIS